MPNFHERLRQLRQAEGLSQQALADILRTSKSSINMYERGEREPSIEMLEAIADHFNVDMGYLLGRSDIPNLYAQELAAGSPISGIRRLNTKRFPLLGNIACGEPIFADEDFEAYVEAGSSIKADFCLRAKGDSMIGARIQDGDIVFIRKQEMVTDGEIAAVLVEDEATLKRVYYDQDAGVLQLFAENPQFKTMRFSGDELNRIRILGKAIAFQSDVK